MLLADMGAQVVRIERPGKGGAADPVNVTVRGREIIELDLRDSARVGDLLDLVAQADVLIEGFRPGVMERLGLGPEVCHARNPALVYGRMTGWGQTGPLAQAAGHDINYVAISGVLNAIGTAGGPPVVPLNLVGDFGGGGMLLAFGVLAAVLRARQTGQGQVVDAAMTDGTALLSSMMWGFRAAGHWSDARGTNLLDGGAHFYGVYECADGKYLALGSIEPQFYAELLQRCGLTDNDLITHQRNPACWNDYRQRFGALFRTRTRDAWCALLEGTDACVSPVLAWDEAVQHPHNQARGTFVRHDGVTQPAPAPRFSATPGSIQPGRAASLDQVRARWS